MAIDDKEESSLIATFCRKRRPSHGLWKLNRSGIRNSDDVSIPITILLREVFFNSIVMVSVFARRCTVS